MGVDFFSLSTVGIYCNASITLATGARPYSINTRSIAKHCTMADTNPADQAADGVAKLYLDEVTGEHVSKTELKKRTKTRERDAAKKEKAASKGPAPTSQKSAESAEKDLTPNQYFEIRSRIVSDLHTQGKAYPHKFEVTYDIRNFADEFKHLKNGESAKEKTIQLGGRIFVRRSAGSKLFFYDLRSDNARLQILAQADNADPNAPSFEDQHVNPSLPTLVPLPMPASSTAAPRPGTRSSRSTSTA